MVSAASRFDHLVSSLTSLKKMLKSKSVAEENLGVRNDCPVYAFSLFSPLFHPLTHIPLS